MGPVAAGRGGRGGRGGGSRKTLSQQKQQRQEEAAIRAMDTARRAQAVKEQIILTGRRAFVLRMML